MTDNRKRCREWHYLWTECGGWAHRPALPDEELDKAYAEWDKARAEWGKAYAEFVKAYAEWDKARAEWDNASAEWDNASADPAVLSLHAKECPNCPWNGRTILP